MPIIILCPSRRNTSRNPPAPKVPRRGSLAADTNGQICQTDTASAERVGPHVATSAPLGVNFGPTCLQDGATWPQLGPVWEQRLTKLKSVWPGFKMGDMACPIRNPQNTPFTGIVHFFCYRDASFEAMFPMLCLRWAQLGAKLSLKGPKLRNVAHDRMSICHKSHHMASLWGPFGSLVKKMGT